MINMLKNLHQDESGQDLIEYGLIALLVALGAIVGMGSLASSINQVFTQVAAQTDLTALLPVRSVLRSRAQNGRRSRAR